jgi:transcriptional regulator with XRE-family HTH domain
VRLRGAELGHLVRERRRGRGMSQGELARAAGLSASRIQQIELGALRFLPEPGHLCAIARELELPLSELLEAAGYNEWTGGDAA